MHYCLFHFQIAAEKLVKQLEAQVAEATAKVDDCNHSLQEINSAKGRLQAENVELARQLEEAESQVAQLQKAKQNAQKLLDEAK